MPAFGRFTKTSPLICQTKSCLSLASAHTSLIDPLQRFNYEGQVFEAIAFNTRVQLVPPNAKEFDSIVFTLIFSRAALGT